MAALLGLVEGARQADFGHSVMEIEAGGGGGPRVVA